MSNFNFKAIKKNTGQEVNITALDNYYGEHKYGYQWSGLIFTEEEFDQAFERVKE